MRINYLDSLRGIAALTVIIYHANCWLDFVKDPYIQSPIPTHILNIFFSGNNAVAIFFVLSGFVLSLKFITPNIIQDVANVPSNKIHIGEFLVKRIFRLYPAFWAVLLLIYVIFGGNPLIYLQESTLLFTQTEITHKIPPDWTLIIEAKMSILMPIFIVVSYYGYRYVAFLGIALLLFSTIGVGVIHFILGIWIAKNFHKLSPTLWQQSKWYPYRYALYALAFVLCSADQFYFIAIRKPNSLLPHTTLGFLATGFGSAMIIIFIICSEKAQKFLEKPILLFLGNISYGIYIGHWLICLDIIENLYFPTLNQMIGSYYLTHIIVRYGLWTVCSILFATILYYGIEKPFIKLGTKTITELRKLKHWHSF
jgi:peptidoglycan/LPS O-acetylase OafA/YrhL